MAGIKGGEDAFEAALTGRTAGEGDEGAEPALMAEGEVGHVDKGAASGEEGAEAHEEDFVKEVVGSALPAGVGDAGQVVRKPAKRGGGIK